MTALDLLTQLHHAWIEASIRAETLTTLSIREALDNPQKLNDAHQAMRESTEKVQDLFVRLEKILKRDLLTEPEDERDLLDVPHFLRRQRD